MFQGIYLGGVLFPACSDTLSSCLLVYGIFLISVCMYEEVSQCSK